MDEGRTLCFRLEMRLKYQKSLLNRRRKVYITDDDYDTGSELNIETKDDLIEKYVQDLNA